MLSFLITIVKLLLILGIVATIHEFGHFIFSKIFKVGVNEFSIGFGPKIIQKKIGETLYSIRWIPLGGYCAIEGEGSTSLKENSLSNKNLIQKLLIFAMGPGFNAILSFIIFFSLSFTGNTATTKIEKFTDDSVAAKSGIQIGDEIVSINGTKTKVLSKITSYFATDKDLKDGVIVKYLRNGETKTVKIDNAVQQIGYLGVTFKTKDENSNLIDMIASGGPAVEAGLKAGDKIVSIAGVKCENYSDVIEEARKHPNEEIEIVLERNGEILTKKITPALKNNFDLGISKTETVKTDLFYALENTKNRFTSIIGSYIDLFTGKVGIKDMSGIVGIGEIVSKSNGFLEFLSLLGMISLAVGIANILPFPPLDGGKIVVSIGETICRKKISEKADMIISYIGFGLLILLTIIVTYRDIIRII